MGDRPAPRDSAGTSVIVGLPLWRARAGRRSGHPASAVNGLRHRFRRRIGDAMESPATSRTGSPGMAIHPRSEATGGPTARAPRRLAGRAELVLGPGAAPRRAVPRGIADPLADSPQLPAAGCPRRRLPRGRLRHRVCYPGALGLSRAAGAIVPARGGTWAGRCATAARHRRQLQLAGGRVAELDPRARGHAAGGERASARGDAGRSRWSSACCCCSAGCSVWVVRTVRRRSRATCRYAWRG